MRIIQRFSFLSLFLCFVKSLRHYGNYEETLLTQEKNIRHCYCKADGTIGKLDISKPACQRLMVSFIPDLRNKDVYSSMTLKCKENTKEFYENPILEQCFCNFIYSKQDNTNKGECIKIVMDDYTDIQHHLLQKCKDKIKINTFTLWDYFVAFIIVTIITFVIYWYSYSNKQTITIETANDSDIIPLQYARFRRK